MSKKRPSARPNTGPSTGPGLPAEGLARMIDEALALLEPRYPAPADTRRALAPPLPSLLDRCEALLAASGGAAPIRLVLGFDDPARHAGMALLDMLPNLHLLPALASPPLASLSPPFALSGPEPALGPAEWNRAAAAAIGTLDASCRARGRSLVLGLDSRAGYDRLPADPGHSLLSSLRDRQPVAAVILARHPLQSWMEMRHCGEAGYHPARLEDYAGRQLAFLHDHADLPVITEADVQADPADALHRLAGSLALPLSPELWSGLQDEVSTLDTGDFWPGLPAGGPVLLDAAGAPATEEPLDSPAYVELCTLLGYAPDQLDLPPRTRTTPAGYGTSGGRTRGTLPEPQPGRPMARLSALLPRIDRLAEATPLPAPARRLDAAQVAAMVEDCLGHPDGFYERLDALLAGLSPADGALLLISCAAHYAAAGEANHGLGLLAEAELRIRPGDRPLRLLAAEVLLTLGNGGMALATLVADALEGPLALPPGARDSLRQFGRLKNTEQDRAGMTGMADAPPVVVIAGMRHSGSTALFNTVRLGFAAMGSEPLVGYSEIGDIVLRANHSVRPTIVKTHEMRDDVRQIASIILTTRRDLRDTVASASRRNFGLMKRLGSPLEYAKYNRMLHEIWAPLSDYQFIYERYMSNPVEVTSEVFGRLGIDTRFAAQVTQQVSALPVDDYQTTLLTPTHITDPERKLSYVDSLDPPAVHAIEREHEAWLITNGYLASSGQDR